MELRTWASGPHRLLRLMHLHAGDGGEEFFWWDTDDHYWVRYKNLFWLGPDGHCQAIDWATLNGYTVSSDRVSGTG
jgi:hypothetical protein